MLVLNHLVLSVPDQYCLKLMKDEQACPDAEACTYLILTVNAIKLDVFNASRIYAGSSYLVWPCWYVV